MRSSDADRLWAVVLAGGVGSRFWPVSTPARPKQLLPLAGESPLITQTVERIAPLVPPEHTRILTGRALAEPLLSVLPTLDDSCLLLEPRAKGTAPVLAWAAHEIANADPDGVMASLHADHVIEPATAFLDLLRDLGTLSAREQRLFTIGAVPTRPETAYGYIQPGPPLTDAPRTFAVDAFVEKPNLPLAEQYVAEGYLWNTGIFVWPAQLLIDEMQRHSPEIATHFPLLRDGRIEEYFDRVPTATIDVALLERSDRIAVAPATFDWDDVGAWDAVARTRARDADGNVAIGDAHMIDAHDCIAWSDEGALVVFGARDLVIVRTDRVTFVAPRSRMAELKTMLERLPASLREPGGAEST